MTEEYRLANELFRAANALVNLPGLNMTDWPEMIALDAAVRAFSDYAEKHKAE